MDKKETLNNGGNSTALLKYHLFTTLEKKNEKFLIGTSEKRMFFDVVLGVIERHLMNYFCLQF